MPMPQITSSFRLLLFTSSANLHSSPFLPSSSLSFLLHTKFPPQTPIHTPHRCSFFTVLSSSSDRPRNHSLSHHNFTRRYHSTLYTQSVDRNKKLGMEETPKQPIGFNKRRAEGGDKSPKKNLQLKVRKLNPVNTISYIQILGTGMDTQDTSPAVLLFFDKQRFIFNAGEGLQRFCTEHKIKLSKIDHIFLSRVCSETAGGLPGLLLTLAGIGEEGMAVNIWGPSDLKFFVDAMKSFIPNAAMVHTRSFGSLPGSVGVSNAHPREFDEPLVLVDDEVVKISAIILRPCCPDVSELLVGESVERRDQLSDGLLSHYPKQKTELADKPHDMSVIYVCELPEIKGKFDPEKAKALGLKPGPKYRELQQGNSVKSDHQNIMVHPSDVLGPSVPGPIVLLVDCPTLLHLRGLLSVQSLCKYYDNNPNNPAESSKMVNCVIHLSPASIVSTSDYQKWMSRFGGAQHIMAGHEMKNIEIPILKASARVAARLNYLCPQFFPAPGFWSCDNLKCFTDGSRSSSEGPFSELCKSVSAENLLKFHLRPYAQLGLDRSSVPKTTTSIEIVDELLAEIPEIRDAAQQINKLWNGNKETREKLVSELDNNVFVEQPWLNEYGIPSCMEDITREDMEIVLLGTGSSQPSKYRNVSSIFMNLFSKGSLLLDCGEGTLGQLKRRFGVEGADDVVKNLRCIWISHIHADHHTGLARILALRRDLLKGVAHEPLIVVGPRQLKRYLDAYQRLEDLDMEFLDCRHTTEASLEAFELSQQTFCTGPNKFGIVDNGKAGGIMTQCFDSTLFAKGSSMQNYLKRPGSLFDTGVAFPILKKLTKILGEAGIESLISFPVVHCPDAFGVVLTAADRINSFGKTIPGWKIVYSGDTRPCPKLLEASRGATVLIHEATFEDGMQDEAEARNHSTTKEAIELGDSAGAYRIILTHFSQRYPKIPVFDETHMHKTCIAFDMMSVNLADLPLLPKVLPYLKLLFRDEMIVDESEEVDADVVTAIG